MDNVAITEGDVDYQVWYEPESDPSLSLAILEGVSELKGVPVDELQPLQYSIDTDSLEEIFCPLSSGGFAAIGEVRFMYDGCVVNVHSTGSIRISPA